MSRSQTWVRMLGSDRIVRNTNIQGGQRKINPQENWEESARRMKEEPEENILTVKDLEKVTTIVKFHN